MVLPHSHQISRVRWYSFVMIPSSFVYRTVTVFGHPFQNVPLDFKIVIHGWPLPRSLAATEGIAVAFFSSGY